MAHPRPGVNQQAVRNGRTINTHATASTNTHRPIQTNIARGPAETDDSRGLPHAAPPVGTSTLVRSLAYNLHRALHSQADSLAPGRRRPTARRIRQPREAFFRHPFESAPCRPRSERRAPARHNQPHGAHAQGRARSSPPCMEYRTAEHLWHPRSATKSPSRENSARRPSLMRKVPYRRHCARQLDRG